MKTLFIIVYFSLLGFVALYGVHLYWLIALYLKSRKPRPIPNGPLGRLRYPPVTVQLPIYNEERVALRLINAVRRFDWPKNKLEIQILDDSTDRTTRLIADYVRKHGSDGPRLIHLRRDNRHGYKAGALAEGLSTAHGEYIAVFDADNLPTPDFLMQMLPHFNDSRVGMVQARWSFLNRTESFLCRAQALFLDAHFHVEQQARSRGGLLFNFNGTAGIWRREVIEDAGGWQHDTLTEDLDLSLRAQLRGWRFVYVDEYSVPTELPNSIAAFKSQQYRWSKGAVETAIKLLPVIFRSPLPSRVKLAAFFHLTHKFVSMALLLLGICLVPALYIRLDGGTTKLFLVDLPIFLAGTGSMTLFYWLANRAEDGRRSWRDRLTMPVLTSLALALAVNNSRALLSAVFGQRTAFVRTPKAGSTDHCPRSVPGSYRLRPGHTFVAEVILAGYAAVAFGLAVSLRLYPTLPFLATFVFGYSYFSLKGIRDWHVR